MARNVYLERTDPLKVGDRWEVLFTAQVKEGGGRGRYKTPQKPLAGEHVFFSVSGSCNKAYDAGDTTNELGVASLRLLVKPGWYIVNAGLEDGPVSKTIKFWVQEEKKSLEPKKLKVEFVRDGLYFDIALTVFDALENGVGIAGREIQLVDEKGVPVQTILEPTDRYGMARTRLYLYPHSETRLKFRVLGTEIAEELIIQKEA